MSAMQFSDEILDEAFTVIGIYETGGAHRMLVPWIQEDPARAAEVMAALSYLADQEKPFKDGHAAYVRGERTERVIELERAYQAKRKRRNRPYQRLREARQATEEKEAV